uniref:Putative Dol-P-Man:Man(7)GlcNAc(2)-PP-Dol alpha-1,6-mannosyltransferase n=1 Tax=Lygus hesperus TaxID=30085 RepID=A0A146LT54_LYGHE
MIGNVIITITLLSIAHKNYPGGSAIQSFHNAILPEQNVHIYIDEVAVQSGVTRFTQTNDQWTYNTTGNINLETADVSEFTHLMIEARSKYSKNLKPFFKSHDIIDTVEGFSHIHVSYQTFPPFRIKTKPILSILQRKIPYKVATRQISGQSVISTGRVIDEEPWLDEPLEKLDSAYPVGNNKGYSQFSDTNVQNSVGDDFEFIADTEKAGDPLFESSLENLDSDKFDVDQSIEEETKKSTRALVDSLIRAKKLKSSMAPELKSSPIESVHKNSAVNETDREFHLSEYEKELRKDLTAVEEPLYDIETNIKVISTKMSRPKIKNRRTKTSSRAFDALQDVTPEEEGNKLLDNDGEDKSNILLNKRKNQVSKVETVQNDMVNEKIGSSEVGYSHNNALEVLKPRSISTSHGSRIPLQDLIAVPQHSNKISAAGGISNLGKNTDPSKLVEGVVVAEERIDKNVQQPDLKFLIETKRKKIYSQQKIVTGSSLDADSNYGKVREIDEDSRSKAYDNQLENALETKQSASGSVSTTRDGNNQVHLKVFEMIPAPETLDSKYKQINSLTSREVSVVGVVLPKTSSLQLRNEVEVNQPPAESTNVPNLRRSREDNVMIWWNIVDTLRDRDRGDTNSVNNNVAIIKNKLYDNTYDSESIKSTESSATKKIEPINS